MKPVTIIIPSYCPDETVKGYEARCLAALEANTPREMYDLVVIGGGDWSYPQKVNAAMFQVLTEWAVILSNDVFVSPGWLPQMIQDFENIDNCALLAPMEKLEPGTITYDDHWWALVLLRPTLFDDLGGLDPLLPHVYHDQCFSIRVRRAGNEICRTGNVAVEHVGMATRIRVGTGDDPKERAEMIRRYGAAELSDWVKLHAPGIPQ